VPSSGSAATFPMPWQLERATPTNPSNAVAMIHRRPMMSTPIYFAVTLRTNQSSTVFPSFRGSTLGLTTRP